MQPLPPASPAGTILLVEDNDGIRLVMTTLLRDAAYRVFDFCDGGAAVEMLSGYDGPLDILVTDTVLPGMTGTEVATHALALRPTLPILFMSGSPRETIMDPIMEGANRFFLAKPFDMTTIVDLIQTLLRSATPPS